MDMEIKMVEKLNYGWPCDYCGELDPDFNSTCEKCFETHKDEIMKKILKMVDRPKRKRKVKND